MRAVFVPSSEVVCVRAENGDYTPLNQRPEVYSIIKQVAKIEAIVRSVPDLFEVDEGHPAVRDYREKQSVLCVRTAIVLCE